jgi:hypothetical protein
MKEEKHNWDLKLTELPVEGSRSKGISDKWRQTTSRLHGKTVYRLDQE